MLSVCSTDGLANKKTHLPERFVGATEHLFSPTRRPYNRTRVSLRSTELRLEGTEDRWKATKRPLAGPEIARVSPDVFRHPAHAALFSTGFASGRTNLRGVVTQRFHAPTLRLMNDFIPTSRRQETLSAALRPCRSVSSAFSPLFVSRGASYDG